MPQRQRSLAIGCVATVLALAGCAGHADSAGDRDGSPPPHPSEADPGTSPTTSLIASPVVEGTFPAGDHGATMSITCWGSGAPTIVLLAGDDSDRHVFPPTLVEPLAQRHLTCGYDRVGTGDSDPPSSRRRTVTDVADDLDRLLTLAGVPGPYALVGSSGGGLLAVEYAVGHPHSTAALALLDIGVPNPHLDRELPGAQGWSGPEHIDWVAGEKRMAELTMPIGDEPVLVLAAKDGQDAAGPSGQRYWLDLSPRASFEVVPGGHDFFQQYPSETADRLLEMLDG